MEVLSLEVENGCSGDREQILYEFTEAGLLKAISDAKNYLSGWFDDAKLITKDEFEAIEEDEYGDDNYMYPTRELTLKNIKDYGKVSWTNDCEFSIDFVWTPVNSGYVDTFNEEES